MEITILTVVFLYRYDVVLSGHECKLFENVHSFILDVKKFVFSNSVINSWNSLPAQCVNCNTVDTLKSMFQLHWNRKPT